MVLQMIELSKQGYTQKQIGEKLTGTLFYSLPKIEKRLRRTVCLMEDVQEWNRPNKIVSINRKKELRYLKQKNAAAGPEEIFGKNAVQTE